MTLQALEEWIETFPDNIAEIKEVTFGGEAEILNRQNSQIEYPCMWVETPAPRMVFDPPGVQFNFFVTFLMNVPNEGDKTQYRAARSLSLLCAQKAYTRFEYGEELGLFAFDRSGEEGDEIMPWSGDRDTGYRFQVRLTVGRSDC